MFTKEKMTKCLRESGDAARYVSTKIENYHSSIIDFGEMPRVQVGQ
jgi:hypothetical protein